MPYFAMDCHVFLQTNFVLQPFPANIALNLKVEVLVRCQMIGQVTLAQEVFRAYFTRKLLLHKCL